MAELLTDREKAGLEIRFTWSYDTPAASSMVLVVENSEDVVSART
jgi:hypothetical protein